MKCPNCNVNLVMTERSGVEIDYCPECRGIWLDRGELDKIIDRSSQQDPNPSSYDANRPKYPSQENKPYDYKKKKRDSFLGDLFDF
jgi:Zn-finger nucleic acid-binding protein